MKNLFRIARITLRFKNALFFNLGFNVLGMFFSLFSFAMIIPLLRVIFNSSNDAFEKMVLNNDGHLEWTKDGIVDYLNFHLATQALNEGRYATLLWICLFLVIMVFVKNSFTFLGNFFLSSLTHSSVKAFRDDMYKKILMLPMSFFSDEKKGDLLSRFSTDLKELEIAIKATTNAIYKDPFYVIGYLVTLFLISTKLTLFILVFLPISGFVISKISSGLKRRSKKGQENLGSILSMTEETLFGLRIIKSFNAQTIMLDRFKSTSQTLYQLMVGINRRVYMASPISEFLGILATAGVLLYGGSMVFDGVIQPDVFIGYLILFSQLINPFKSISKSIYDSSQGIAALDRIEDVIEKDEKIINAKTPKTIGGFSNEIVFENVDFSYVDELVLQKISFSVKRGESVALVGHSGAGKSTLADLLIRFYDVNAGEIKIDGQNIKEINIEELRDLMGVVTQDSIIFNDTVANNIAFGSEKVDLNAVKKAAQMANAHEFIEGLENKYETIVGDAGNKLSGGQKQRISIARALYKNPEILILDEATSSLDTASEMAVQQALDRLMSNRTSLVIAHRLSTIQNADKIIVLDKGKIVEMGTHKELLVNNNYYKKFIDLQSIK